MSNFWDRILLVCNFNMPHYSNAPFIRHLYRQATDLVFYGNLGDPTHPSETSDEPTPDIALVNQGSGHWAQAVVLEALKEHKGFDGYLFFVDDDLLSLGRMSRLDRNAIWYHAPRFDGRNLGYERGRAFWPVADAVTGQKSSEPWHWPTESGLAAWHKAWPNLPANARETLVRLLGGQEPCYGDVADVFYLPSRLREQAIAMLEPTVESKVWMEIAIPSMLLALEPVGHWDLLSGVCLWGPQYPYWRGFATYPWDWIHPVKFSHEDNRKDAEAILEGLG